MRWGGEGSIPGIFLALLLPKLRTSTKGPYPKGAVGNMRRSLHGGAGHEKNPDWSYLSTHHRGLSDRRTDTGLGLPGWVIPAIAAAGVGGIALGAGISSAQAQTTGSIFSASPVTPAQPQISYDPNTMVQPGCHLARERIRGEWRRVEVCP